MARSEPGLVAVVAILVIAAGCAGPPAQVATDAAVSPAYPDPARFEAAIRDFEAADRRAFPPPGAVLCLGSSSIRMWHDTLARDLAPHPVIPRGFGGSTMLDALHYAPRIVLPYRPARILLYEGDNDLDLGVTPADFLTVFRRFVALVHAELPDTEILVLAIKPSGARWARWPAMREANQALRTICGADPRLRYVDVATPLLGAAGRPREELYLPDRLHLNDRGYALWTEVVRAALAGDTP